MYNKLHEIEKPALSDFDPELQNEENLFVDRKVEETVRQKVKDAKSMGGTFHTVSLPQKDGGIWTMISN